MRAVGKILFYYLFFMLLLIRRRKVLRLLSTWPGTLGTLYAAYLCFCQFKPRQNIAGKLILITGGGRGIGKAIALELARRGARVVLWDVNTVALNETLAELKKNGAECWGFVVDISDRQQVHDAGLTLRASVGTLWGLINNAGIIGTGKALMQTPDSEVEKTLEVNLLAHAWTLKEFLPDMMERDDGHVVAVSSFGGFVASPGMAIYSASKAGVISLMEGVRLELRKSKCFNVGTSIICPGHVLTELFTGFQTNQLVMPSLSPEYVAAKVVEALQRRWPMVIMPFFGNLAIFNKAVMPPSWYDFLSELGGVSRCMDNFKGLSSKDPPLGKEDAPVKS